MTSRGRWLPVVLCLLALPKLAGAAPATFQRATQNLLFAPADVVLAPWVAGRVLHRNLGESDDATAVKVLFVVPGYAWSTAVQVGGGLVRALAGILELGPGIALLAFEPDLPALFEPPERGAALVDADLRWLRMRLGVDYLTLPR